MIHHHKQILENLLCCLFSRSFEVHSNPHSQEYERPMLRILPAYNPEMEPDDRCDPKMAEN